jgi:anthranilate/para-aminobenzoate synthase component I
MNPAVLEPLASFALLGPGFGGGRALLLRDLRPAAAAEPLLAFVPFEGRRARTYRAATVEACDIACAPASRPLDVSLAAAGHAGKVATIRAAIARGDVYQVCLTERARVPAVPGAELLARMAARGLPRFAAWVRLPDGGELVSASPELFFEIDGDQVHTEPMKGTARPEDAGALARSAKDQAELAMITDLLRNDLTPVCRPGTVRVAEERRVLVLPYALQTVSDVVGVLAEGVAPLDVLGALHPGGSVTGAPKRAALAMIGALEEGPRGAYCGALGLVAGTRATFSLLIRTAERSPSGWTYGVGGGIVHDSDPDAERAELETKLGALRSHA